jgi:hypothetical protein
LAGLLEWIVIEQGPTNYVPQVGCGVATEVSKKSDVSGKVQKFRLYNVARADISCCHDGCP